MLHRVPGHLERHQDALGPNRPGKKKQPRKKPAPNPEKERKKERRKEGKRKPKTANTENQTTNVWLKFGGLIYPGTPRNKQEFLGTEQLENPGAKSRERPGQNKRESCVCSPIPSNKEEKRGWLFLATPKLVLLLVSVCHPHASGFWPKWSSRESPQGVETL